MKKQFAVLLLGLAAVLVAAGQLARAAAGPSPGDIQDSRPAFSSNGVDIAFERGAAGQTSRVLDMTAGGTSAHVVTDGILRGWVPGTEDVVVQIDGEHTLVLADSGKGPPRGGVLGVDATPSPDATKLVYLRGGSLYVSAIDGTGERAIAQNVQLPASDSTGPVWSPDGRRIAVASQSSLLVVQADGSGPRALTTTAVNPSWSPDGATLAVERAGHVLLVAAGTGSERVLGSGRLPRFSPVSSTVAFLSNRRGQYSLYIQATAGGVAERLVYGVVPTSAPEWSPTAAQIAVAAPQECRRAGIYVVRANIGASAHRRSNLCRLDGTAAADRIVGTPYFDLINGNGGSDVIHGNGGNDKISGENGNDTIYGDAGNDFILAGPGDDRIFGGPGNDVIIGGNGHDVIDCGPGNDRVEGVGPLDTVAKNCEHVSR